MSPEYGATIGFFPVDDQTLAYLRLTGRAEEQIKLVETYCKAQGLFRVDGRARSDLSPIRSNSIWARSSRVSPGRAVRRTA